MTFADRLSTLRKSHNLTVRALGRMARVPHSLISGIETGTRTIGEFNARKIGVALQLGGEELEAFIYLALNDAAGKVLEENKAYPAEVLNLVPSELHGAGIHPAQVLNCALTPKWKTRSNQKAEIQFKDGGSALISVTIAHR